MNSETPRAAVGALLLAQFAVIIPLIPTLPLWMAAVWAVVAAWYWKIVYAAWSFPGALAKFALVALSMFGIYLQYGQWLGLEPMVATLVLAVVLKLLEMKSRRDHYLILLLCYAVVACRFLFEQQIPAVLLAIFQLLLLLIAQQAMYRQQMAWRRSLRLASLLLLQGIPLMLFLFMAFPRIGPLWSMPLPGGKAQTGMSDELEFGDIADLSQSGELAFRVSFEGEPPASEQLYWRGLVLEEFDGRRWSRMPLPRWERPSAPVLGPADLLNYTVILEPGVHKWLYTLPVARINRSDIDYGGDYQWLASPALTGRLQYSVESRLEQRRDELSRQRLAANLRTPGVANARARALADRWRMEYTSAADRVAAALTFFRQGQFVYTLQPPVLGEDNVDAFLFESRQGFCEHYAGSFVFLMRAAGVPARLVVGYQGGEYNRDGRYLLVHQSDAHAWAEVWLDGEGWRRVDPTQTVAPDRVRLGAEQLLRGQQDYLGQSPLSLRHFEWARDLRLYMDELNYAWAKWVLNYDDQTQEGVLRRLLGEISVQRVLLALLLFGGLPLAVIAGITLWPRKRAESKELRYYRAAERALLRRTGLRAGPGDTPGKLLRKVWQQAPEWAPWFGEVCDSFEVCCYRPGGSADQALRRLKQLRRPYRANDRGSERNV